MIVFFGEIKAFFGRAVKPGNVEYAPEMEMKKKPDMVMVIITLFVVSVLASSVAQSALM